MCKIFLFLSCVVSVHFTAHHQTYTPEPMKETVQSSMSPYGDRSSFV
jgi:hypothetical protein